MIWGHLSRDELLGLVDREDWGHPHLATCERCRRDVDELRTMIEELRGVPVPEPSPLFWDHLTRRVREAIEAEPPQRGEVRERWWALVPASLVVALAVGLLWWTLPSRASDPPHVAAEGGRSIEGERLALDLDAARDDPWEALLALADEVSWDNGSDVVHEADEAVGQSPAWSVGLPPSSIDRAILALSDEERAIVRELVLEEQRGNGGRAVTTPQG